MCEWMLHWLNSVSHTHTCTSPPPPPPPPFWVEAPHFERFRTQLSFHPSSSSSHSLPVFPLMSPAPSAPISSRAPLPQLSSPSPPVTPPPLLAVSPLCLPVNPHPRLQPCR